MPCSEIKFSEILTTEAGQQEREKEEEHSSHDIEAVFILETDNPSRRIIRLLFYVSNI